MEGVVLPRIFVGGGQEYHGPTATRDCVVVELTAKYLYSLLGDSVEIVTGGTAGVPEDFAKAWHNAGGKHVLCIVSSEHEEAYLLRGLPFKHQVVGKTQTERRLAVTKLERIKCAFFVQGGKFSTHEMKLFEENNVPIISFWGSGGAAGGGQPYEGWTFDRKPNDSRLTNAEPDVDPHACAEACAHTIKAKFPLYILLLVNKIKNHVAHVWWNPLANAFGHGIKHLHNGVIGLANSNALCHNDALLRSQAGKGDNATLFAYGANPHMIFAKIHTATLPSASFADANRHANAATHRTWPSRNNHCMLAMHAVAMIFA